MRRFRPPSSRAFRKADGPAAGTAVLPRSMPGEIDRERRKIPFVFQLTLKMRLVIEISPRTPSAWNAGCKREPRSVRA
jgi:hypothetical protein